MREAIKITLGGNEYSVRPFSIGQHRKISGLMKLDPTDFALGILAIALERAEPRPADAQAIECLAKEAMEAAGIVLRENGYAAAPEDEVGAAVLSALEGTAPAGTAA